MRPVAMSKTAHKFKLAEKSDPDQVAHLYECSVCGLDGKRYGVLEIIYIDDNAPSECNKQPQSKGDTTMAKADETTASVPKKGKKKVEKTPTQEKNAEATVTQTAMKLKQMSVPDKLKKLQDLQHRLDTTMNKIENNRTEGRELRKNRDTYSKQISDLINMFDQEEMDAV